MDVKENDKYSYWLWLMAMALNTFILHRCTSIVQALMSIVHRDIKLKVWINRSYLV